MNVRRHFSLSLVAGSLIRQMGGAQELPEDIRQEIGSFLAYALIFIPLNWRIGYQLYKQKLFLKI